MAAKQGNGLLIGAAVVGVAYLAYKELTKSGVITPPLVAYKLKQDTERMRIGKVYAVKFKNDEIEFKFPIENPNSQPMTIDAIVGDLYVPDKNRRLMKIGTIAHYGHTVIKANGSTDFDLVTKVKLLNEFVYLSQLFSGQIKGIAAQFKGTVNANNRPWTVTETIALT